MTSFLEENPTPLITEVQTSFVHSHGVTIEKYMIKTLVVIITYHTTLKLCSMPRHDTLQRKSLLLRQEVTHCYGSCHHFHKTNHLVQNYYYLPKNNILLQNQHYSPKARRTATKSPLLFHNTLYIYENTVH